ncbi:hypothetical protein CBF29_01865 [Vagococcus elongatus]|uniref:Flavin reductase like domain-containing protein n=2 Tax=Vagococcus elongatus TaxID=180344 RepID=A0A430B4H1_9ENTE|nr:hypothetical protein CBF29_01865 [Vagococcus elongatus]
MHVYRSEELSKAEQYKFLSGSIIPRPIAWIMTKDSETGNLNLAPFSFFSGVSNEEPLLSLAILRVQGEMKDTARNLLNQKEGVIHLVEEHLLEKMNETSRRLAPEESELSLIDVTLVPSETVSLPGILEANLRLETRLHNHIPITSGDSEAVVTDLFILKVTAFQFASEIFDEKEKHFKLDKLKAVGRLSGPNYAVSFDELVELERPQ